MEELNMEELDNTVITMLRSIKRERGRKNDKSWSYFEVEQDGVKVVLRPSDRSYYLTVGDTTFKYATPEARVIAALALPKLMAMHAKFRKDEEARRKAALDQLRTGCVSDGECARQG
jgi:hypothetical protein